MIRKKLLWVLTIFLSFNCYSQISFEKGYFIDNTNQRVNCLIKNVDWKNNPTEFKYKLSENSEVIKATIKTIKEFGINNISKYIRSSVNIDRSSDNFNNLSNDKNPIFQNKTLFLKVLVEGKANLYQYVNNRLRRYFFNKDNSNIEQLIFKRYKITEKNNGENNRFRQQLWINLKCPNFKISKIKNLEYTKSDLIPFFIKYSECQNNESISFEPKQKLDLFNLTIRPRLNNSSFKILSSPFNLRSTDFGNKVGLGIGVEAEFIIPFNKNKLAIAVEPTYQSFKSKKTTSVTTVSGGILNSNINYNSIEIPLSLRHYFFIKKNSKIFINASYIFDFGSNSSIEFTRKDGSLLNSIDIEKKNNTAFGIGYKQNDRYSLELRYITKKDIIGLTTFNAAGTTWNSEYETLSIIFGFSLF